MGVLTVAWALVKPFLSSALGFLTGLSARTWAIIGIVAALAIGALWINNAAYDRGSAAQKIEDADVLRLCKDEKKIVTDNRDELKRQLDGQSAAVDAAASKGQTDSAAAAARAQKAKADAEASRLRDEADLSTGPDRMNGWLQSTFGGPQ
jgi:hypothetical protein